MNHQRSYLLFVGNALYAVFSFLSIAILSHLLSPHNYGFLRYLLSLSSIFSVFISLGFAQSVYYYLNSNPDSGIRKQYINANRMLLLGLGLIFTILLYFIRPETDPAFIAEQKPLLFGLIAFTFITGIQSCDLNILLVLNKPIFYFINTLSLFLIRMGLFFYIYHNQAPTYYYLYAMCFTAALAYIINQGYIEVQFPTKTFAFSINILKQLWNYAWPIGLGLAFGILLSQADRMLIMQMFHNPSDVALISNGNFEVPLITVFYTSFSTVALPTMIKAFQENDQKLLIHTRQEYQVKVASMLFPLVFVLIAWSKPIIQTAFGAYYIQSAVFFSIYAITFFFRFSSYHDVFLLSNKTKYIGIIQAVELVFHVLLTYLCLTWFGLIGASIAAVVTNFVYVSISSYVSASILKVSISQLYPFRSLSSIFLKSFVFILPFFAISSFIDSIFVQLIMAALAGVFTFAMLNGFKFKLK